MNLIDSILESFDEKFEHVSDEFGVCEIFLSGICDCNVSDFKQFLKESLERAYADTEIREVELGNHSSAKASSDMKKNN